MVKKHLLKKGIAYLLSAAMVLASTGVMPGGVKTVSAAVEIPAPVISMDFDSGTTSGNTYTENGIAYTLTDSEITNNPDDNSNKVFYNGGDTTGFIQSGKIFGNKNFSDGISFHMKVRPNTQASDWNFLFGMGFNNDGWQVFDGTIGFITREWTTAHFKDYFPGGNWQPGNNLGGSAEANPYDYFMQADNCNKWYDLAYVYGTDGNFSIYVDGVLTVKYTAEAGYDAVFGSIGGNINAIFSLGGNIFTGTSTDETDLKRCDAYYDDVQIYNKALTQEQVSSLASRVAITTDKKNLDVAISEANTIREELCTSDTVAIFNTTFKEKLNSAMLVKSNIAAEQNEVDSATSDLNAAIETIKLKPVDLTTDLVLDSNMTSVTSVIDKTKKEVVAGGHTITAMGTSSIGEGYIQSSIDGAAQGAGISLDTSVLDGASLDKGLTFNINWNFSTAPASDWWDLFSIVDENNNYLMRNTVGFINFTEGDTNTEANGNHNVYPGADCKNGFGPFSCKSYETGIVKNLAVTIDNTGIRMYVDGVLACEKTDMAWFDFGYVFENMAKIYIGYAVNADDGDLQGQLHGLQVYHRALNAAEIDTLANKGTGTSFELSSVTASIKKGETGTVSINDTAKPADTTIKSVVSEDESIATAKIENGKLVITGVGVGETSVIVNTSYGQSAACKVTIYTEKVAVTGLTLDKETASIEKGGTLTLNATVLPENATDKGIIWTSSNEAVATVNTNGIVTALATGTTTITATSNEKDTISASCVVTVTESSTPGGDTPGDDDIIDIGEITDESQLGLYRSDLAYKRVSVHDPSIVQDPKTKRYYLFGSHCAWAWSDDLENWTSFANNITEKSAETIFANEIAWCKKAKNGANYTIAGNLWAPDVIWSEDYVNKDGSKGAWLMYMSINGPDWNSTISLLTSDRLDGNWTYVGPVIQSGMSKGYGVTFDYTKVTGETTVNSRYTSNVSNAGNPTLEAHAIDPCVLYDEAGNLWMTYGSWSGGISMIKLDTKTGLRDYTTKYNDTNNAVGDDGFITDPYTGYKIAGGTAVSGEGSYIKKIGDYYFLFLSYGGYAPTGGYNMRMFRSKDIKGPYKDVANKDARYAENNKAGDTAGTTGMRLISFYKWSFTDYGYTAQGHNSATVDENGKAYVIYHNKYDDGTAAHEVRVHQLLTNEDGWILAAPFEYAGETVKTTGYSQSAFTGDYGIMFQKQNIDHAKLQCATEQKITLEEGTLSDGTYTGNITGDYTGTWTSKEGSPYVTLKIGNTTYKGIFCEGTIDETSVQTMTFTAVGDNQECLWGYKVKDPTVAIRMTIDKVIKIPDEVATDIPLPATGAGGSTITWKSNSVAINDDGTIPHLFNEDTKVSMTATIKNSGKEFDKVYEFVVVGNERLSDDGDVVLKELYTDEALDMSTLKQGNTPGFPNPFYYTHEDISDGVSISFDVVRTAPSDRLSNIISFNNKLAKLYFTGGSYLGYNDFGDPLHVIDANLNSGYAPGIDYLADNTKVTIKIAIDSNGFTVYNNDTKAYSSSEVGGSVPGTKSDNNPEKTMLAWLKTAPELNFGSGNFWNDLIFKGTVSNVICSYKQPALDVEGGSSSLSGLYTQDYESVRDISKEWISTNAQDNISLGSGDEGHGKYMLYDFGSVSGSRGAYSYFGKSITWPDNYILEYDMLLKAGNEYESQVAVLTSNAADFNKNENNGIDTGYIFKMVSKNSETWTINGDSARTVVIPKTAWVHVVLTGTKDSTTAHLKITNGDTSLFDDDVTATDTGTIKGLHIIAGRSYAQFKIDNIVVKEPGVDYVDRTAYDNMLNRAEQYIDAQTANGIYTDESYQTFTGIVDTAKNTITNTSTQEDVNSQVAVLKDAISKLERKTCTIEVEEAANGIVTGLAAGGKYFAGDYIMLKAVPNDGYSFESWKSGEDIIGKYTVYSAMVTGNMTITPVFKSGVAPTPAPIPTPTPTPTQTPGGEDDNTTSPAPGESASPVPGESTSPIPGESASPVPGESTSPAPGESASPVPGDSTTSPAPGESNSPSPTGSGSVNNPGIGSYVPTIPVTPDQPGQPGASTAPGQQATPAPAATPGVSQTPAASAEPENSAAPVPSQTPVSDIKVDEETGTITETITEVDDNKTIVIEKVTMPDGTGSVKETVTEDTGALTVVTETLTNTGTDSVLVTKITSDTNGNVIDASATVYTGTSDTKSQYSVKTIIPENYFDNVKSAGLDSVDIYVEKTTVDIVKTKLAPKMLIKISVPETNGVSVGKVIVTKESIESAKGSSKKLVVKMQSKDPSNSYTVTIPQSELKKMDKAVNVAVKTDKVSGMGSSNSKKVNKVLNSNKVGEDNSYIVTMASNNTKGGIKVTTPAMLPDVKAGDKVYAYCYNKKTGKLEEIPNSQRPVIKKGEVAIEGFSGNTYVITDKELSGKNVVTLLDNTKVSVGKSSVKAGSKTKVNVGLGTGLVAKPSVKSSTAYGKQAAVVTYKSSNPGKAKVSKDGTITAKSKGKVQITVKIKLAGGKVKKVKKTVVIK